MHFHLTILLFTNLEQLDHVFVIYIIKIKDPLLAKKLHFIKLPDLLW